jgi:hypothetical protein
MEVTSSSRMSVDIQWTTQHYISKDRTLDNHLCENLKSHKFSKICEEDANWLHAHVQQIAVTDVNIHHVTELNLENKGSPPWVSD